MPLFHVLSCGFACYLYVALRGDAGNQQGDDLLRNGNCFYTTVTEEHMQLSTPQKARAGKFRGEHLTSQSLETIGRLLPLMSTTAHWLREEEKDVTVGEFER